MRLFLSLPLILLTSGAWALDPPAHFDHYPSPPPIIHAISNIEAACPAGTINFSHYACAYRFKLGGPCEIWIASQLGGATREAVLRHEYAHCNGWAADHT